ncbi:sulfotransferase [Qipengyuania sp. 6B39]|uniref:sulfotransferase family protein n=1 Tax=Qipengyuania proteolytica TaxID=2867239 RepID=UPI001C892263|nr:sulfotransferase [Qipengyuania proteolytica]MBX7495355.1 sulfotransferase [Qipengyuania proteolytica]
MNAPPRPHPFARSKAAELAGRAVEALWDKGLTEKPPLEPEFLWQVGAKGFTAEDECSIRSAEEVADFRDRLARLCRALNEEADLNPLGHTMAYGQLTAAIRKRHALGRFWRDAPELAGAEIAPPIIVVGQMRSGTTRIHRLLAADPRHAGTRFCNSHDPVPRTPDLRPLKSAIGLAIGRRINPWLDMLHPFGATRVDEEIGWLSGSLDACAFEAQWRIPSFVAFNEASDARAVYAEFARILRTDAAVMGDAAKPRVLKCPQFAENLPALIERFPEARMVVAKRCHDEVLESSVSMVASQMAFQSDHADLDALVGEWRRKLALREARMDAALAGHSGPLAGVDFAALGEDWEAEIARVYSAIGIPLSDEALAAMRGEQARAAKDKHHGHRRQFDGFRNEGGRTGKPVTAG